VQSIICSIAVISPKRFFAIGKSVSNVSRYCSGIAATNADDDRLNNWLESLG
jgi:hypothetical protein